MFLDAAPRTVAVSGGTGPQPLYERLAEASFPWPEVDVVFADERCVPPDHRDSNFRLVSDLLFSRLGDRGPRVHRMPGESCDAAAYERTLRDGLGWRRPSLDLAVLGIGEDGHVASLFPEDAALEERERLVVAVERPDYRRLTLTLPVLSSARVALFLVRGEAKREALDRLLRGDDVPATRVRAGEVVVVADPAAAGRGPTGAP